MKKLGNPTPQNYVYSTVKVLLERIAPVMIDSVAIQELVSFVSDAVKGTGAICDEIPNATENGMKLLLVGRRARYRQQFALSNFSSPLETISTSLWVSVHINCPVLSVFSNVSCHFIFVHIFPDVVEPSTSRPPPSSLPRYDNVRHFS